MKTVLIVEDEADIRGLLRLVLESAGYEVLQTESGEEALDLIAEQQPDAVLLDLLLPGIDGFEVLRRLKERHLPGDTKIIMVSANSAPDTPRRAIESGCAAYVVKPFDPAELLEALNASLTG